MNRGAEELVRRRCFKKQGAGSYNFTDLGIALFCKLALCLDKCIQASVQNRWVNSIVFPIRRTVLRPDPRSLTNFSLLRVRLLPILRETDLECIALAYAALMEFFQTLSIGLSVPFDDLRKGIHYRGPKQNEVLHHTLCSAECIEKKEIDIYVGLEVAAILIAHHAIRWPQIIAPADIEIFSSKSTAEPDKVRLEEALSKRGIVFERLTPMADREVFAPARIIIAQGERPYRLKAGNLDERFQSPEEVLNRWQSVGVNSSALFMRAIKKYSPFFQR